MIGRRRLFKGIIALAAWAGLAVAAPAQMSSSQSGGLAGNVIGAADAPLTIVEYASFSCPHCAAFHTRAWPMLKSEFIETGQVRFELRPILTPPTQLAAAGAVMADCVADEYYFDAADLLFAEQMNILRTAQARGDIIAIYNRIGAALGLTEEDVSACFSDPVLLQRVNDTATQAMQDGIPGTPTFIVRGQLLRTEMLADGNYFTYGGEPLILNGERVPGALDGDSFRRIVLHFLNTPDSGQ